MDTFSQIIDLKERLQKHIDKHQRALIVDRGIYTPDNATVVYFTKLYPHFMKGYTLVKRTGVKIPYTLTYNQIIAHDFNEESQWEDGSKLWDLPTDEKYSK